MVCYLVNVKRKKNILSLPEHKGGRKTETRQRNCGNPKKKAKKIDLMMFLLHFLLKTFLQSAQQMLSVHPGALTVVGGDTGALWEDLHTVLCTMELPLSRWADSVCLCECYNNPWEPPSFTLPIHPLSGISAAGQRVSGDPQGPKKWLLIWSEVSLRTLLKEYGDNRPGEHSEASGHTASVRPSVVELVSDRHVFLFKLCCFSTFYSVLI